MSNSQYMPKSLDEVIYPDHATRLAIEAFASGKRSGHVCLIGPMGTGKSTVANLLPRAIAPDAAAGGEILEVDCAQKNSVSDIQQLINGFMSISAFNSSGKRFVILEEADMLSAQAQRMLKRPLEMKAEHVMCIMTTNHSDKLNPEMMDRFATFEFRKLPSDELVALAVRVLGDRGIVLPSDNVAQIIARSDNSFRRLFRLLDDLTELVTAKSGK